MLTLPQLHDQTNPQAESSAPLTMSTSAADAVLSTTELLEHILSHLDIKNLVLLHRVSHHWCNVMAESLVLQRAMFLVPEPELPFKWHLQWVSVGQPWRYIKKTSGTALETGETVVLKSARFNPVLFERRSSIESKGVRNGRQSVRLYTRNNVFFTGTSDRFARMLIAQPPITRALLGLFHRTIEVRNENGIIVADIIRALNQKDRSSRKPSLDALSLVVTETMFPSTDEEKQGLILRPCSIWSEDPFYLYMV